MKKLLLLIPLLLVCGCDYSEKIYTNVDYSYDYDTHVYKVFTENGKQFDVKVEHYHEVKVDELRRETKVVNGTTYYLDYIYNEFFSSNKVLYVYEKR